MPYKINIINKKGIITFNDTAAKKEITNAFLEIVENVDVKELDYIIFDCTEVINYVLPADYLWRGKLITKFSESWNPNITIICVATNSEIRFMASAFVKISKELKWNYKLFKNLEETNQWLDKND
jgi:hypothetical protein